MADRYLKSGAAGAANGTSWADAYTTLAAAFAGSSAGDRIWVSDAHAETQASAMTLTSPGTAASPVQVICVDDSAEPPTARATTATISTTGANSITWGGAASYYGIGFSSGTSGNTAALFSGTGLYIIFDSCSLAIPSTDAGGLVRMGSSANAAQRVEWINTTYSVGHTSRYIDVCCHFVWRDTPASAASGIATLFSVSTLINGGPGATIRNVNLAALGSGTNLVNVNGDRPTPFRFENCKLGSGVTIATGSIVNQGGLSVTAINCDSADTNYRYHKQNYQGTVTQETTIVRTGGATDGTTPISRKMVSTANSKIYSPLEGESIVFWNESLAEQTVTVQVVTDNVTLTDAEAWIDVEYLGTSGFPLGVTGSDRISDPIFGTPANQPTSSATWTTTGLTTPVKQSFTVTFTALEKGWVRVTPKLAKASTTMYYCPLVSAGSGRQWMTPTGMINEGDSGGDLRNPAEKADWLYPHWI